VLLEDQGDRVDAAGETYDAGDDRHELQTANSALEQSIPEARAAVAQDLTRSTSRSADHIDKTRYRHQQLGFIQAADVEEPIQRHNVGAADAQTNLRTKISTSIRSCRRHEAHRAYRNEVSDNHPISGIEVDMS
jgi:hypothetical protein